MKNKLTFLIIAFLLAVGFVAFARSAQSATPRKVTLPPQAIEVAPGLYDLGVAKDSKGRDVQGYAIFRFGKEESHNPGHNKGGGGVANSCFAYLSKGAKWRVVEDYLVDSTNSDGLSSSFVTGTVGASLSKWEDAADGVVDGSGYNIFGNEVSGIVDGPDQIAPDDKNEVMFGDIDTPGALAATYYWGIFAGPPSSRELVEWDQVYDDVDFDWADALVEPTKIDFDNVVTHEHGHVAGMGHPSDSCTEETMYRFASEGETKKRDLNSGDIKGISDLY